jgi:hypothetical protein
MFVGKVRVMDAGLGFSVEEPVEVGYFLFRRQTLKPS